MILRYKTITPEATIQYIRSCVRPSIHMYAISKQPLLAGGIATSKQLRETLLTEARVAMLPGSDFYLPDTRLGVRVASVDYDGEHVLQRFPGASAMDQNQLTTLFPNLVHGCDRLNGFLAQL